MKKETPEKRILAIRTDRIGDVLLTTPALRAIRKAFPEAHLALLVRPYTRELVENNPDIDEVIVYDKRKGIGELVRLIRVLRKAKFESAIVFNPKLRNNLIAALAGIPRRISYQTKGGWLANIRVENRKYLDSQHELDWNLNFVKFLGVDVAAASRAVRLFVNQDAQEHVNEFLKTKNITGEKLIVIHPGATAPSKKWPTERFARLADELRKEGFRIMIVGSSDEKTTSRRMLSLMGSTAEDASGIFSLQQLSALLKRCRLFVSNDAGPIHIASALGTPTVAIFGRKAGGLGPRSWTPGGENVCVLQKDVGCQVCLPDSCPKDFACLEALAVSEVLDAVKKLLERRR